MEGAGVAAPTAGGFLHPLYSDAEREFGLGVLGRQAPSRETIAGVSRALRPPARPPGPSCARRCPVPAPMASTRGRRTLPSASWESWVSFRG